MKGSKMFNYGRLLYPTVSSIPALLPEGGTDKKYYKA